jgi:DNA polymerase-1
MDVPFLQAASLSQMRREDLGPKSGQQVFKAPRSVGLRIMSARTGNEPRLVIIDGYSLLFRAFYATRFMSTTDGRPTNALYGFTMMLFNLLERVKPAAIVVALDAPGKTFRHAEYAEYKGTRRETQDELKVQLTAAREFIAALKIPTREVVGFEADDVVGTISRLAEEHGYCTTIVTGDLDALQLVDPFVSVLTPKTGVTDTMTYDRAAVEERYGFGPEHIADFKALKGDSSDNIPGVPGIGDKGAADLIQKFGTIEVMIEKLADVEPKYAKKISGQETQMVASKRLATIIRDVPLEYDFQPFVLSDQELAAAKAFLESYEMRSLARRADIVLGAYLEGASTSESTPAAEVVEEAIEARLSVAKDLSELSSFIQGRPFAAYFPASVAQTSLFEDPLRMGYIAIGSDVREAPVALAIQLVKQHPELAITHDAKPIYRRAFGTERVAAPKFDALLAGFVLQSGRTQYALRDLIQGYLEVQTPSKPEEFAVALGLLEGAMEDRLAKEGQTRVLHEIEQPLIPILARMEVVGIRADRNGLREFSKSLEVTIAETQKQIYAISACEFNLGSPKQLGEVLFEKMGLPGAQKTKTGYATGVEVLGELALEHEIAALVLNWRELSKLKSTYADALEKLIAEDGRIHTTYNQTGAATGRLSSNDPNMQNIPIRTELGRGIRRAFVAGDGYELASLDYSQIELRVLAHMSHEASLVEAFRTGEDVHSVTAKSIFHLGTETPTKEQRRLAKMLNYAVLYGVTEYGLAQQLGAGFSIAEAKELIREYNERFPHILEFTQSIVAEARAKGFTTTLVGRRRYFPDIHAVKVMERRYAERQAMNAPIQGTAADLLKLAMISVDHLLQGRQTRMLLNVHDELVFEVPPGEESLIPSLREAMGTALPMDVPIDVDAKVGQDWDAMTPV